MFRVVGGGLEQTPISLNFYFLLPYSRLAILPSPAIDWKIWKALYSRGCSVGWLVVCHGRDSSDVTLALEDAQVVRRSVGRY